MTPVVKMGPIIAAQVRAGRALLGWSQEQLADEAGVGLSSVRDFESLRRAANTEAVGAIRRALENGGVVFVSGGKDEGPGVRLVAGRPNIVQLPTTMTMWDGMPFRVERQGKIVTAFVAREILDDLGRFRETPPFVEYLGVFERHRGAILDGVRRAMDDPESVDERGNIYVRGRHVKELFD
jgi:transcriptional regulator with XRE-family HTH domain